MYYDYDSQKRDRDQRCEKLTEGIVGNVLGDPENKEMYLQGEFDEAVSPADKIVKVISKPAKSLGKDENFIDTDSVHDPVQKILRENYQSHLNESTSYSLDDYDKEYHGDEFVEPLTESEGFTEEDFEALSESERQIVEHLLESDDPSEELDYILESISELSDGESVESLTEDDETEYVSENEELLDIVTDLLIEDEQTKTEMEEIFETVTELFAENENSELYDGIDIDEDEYGEPYDEVDPDPSAKPYAPDVVDAGDIPDSKIDDNYEFDDSDDAFDSLSEEELYNMSDEELASFLENQVGDLNDDFIEDDSILTESEDSLNEDELKALFESLSEEEAAELFKDPDVAALYESLMSHDESTEYDPLTESVEPDLTDYSKDLLKQFYNK